MAIVGVLAMVTATLAVVFGTFSLPIFLVWWIDFRHDAGATSMLTHRSEDKSLFKGWSPVMWWQFMFRRTSVLLVVCSVSANLLYVARDWYASMPSYWYEPRFMPWLLILTGVYLVLTLVSKAMYMRLKLLEARSKLNKQQAPAS